MNLTIQNMPSLAGRVSRDARYRPLSFGHRRAALARDKIVWRENLGAKRDLVNKGKIIMQCCI